MSPEQRAALKSQETNSTDGDTRRVIYHSGDRIPGDAPGNTPLEEVAGQLETPVDPSRIDPATGKVSWEPIPLATQERKTSRWADSVLGAPLWVKVATPLAIAAATGIGWATNRPSAPQGQGTVAASTANPGETAPPNGAAPQPGGPSPSPEASAPTTTIPEVKQGGEKLDTQYYTTVAKFPTPELALREIFRKHDAYVVSGDVKSTIEGEKSQPGDKKYIQAMLADPDGELAKAFVERSTAATLLRGTVEQQSGKAIDLKVTTTILDIESVVQNGDEFVITLKMSQSSNAPAVAGTAMVNPSWLTQFDGPPYTSLVIVKKVGVGSSAHWQVDTA